MAGAGMQMWRRVVWAWLPVLAWLLAATPALAAEQTIQRAAPRAATAGDLDDDGNARVIVKYRQGSALAQSRQGAQRLGRQLQLTLTDGHRLGARSQSLRGRGVSPQVLASRLAAQADVEWAVPVRRKTVQAVVPNDPLFADNQTAATPAAGQWYLRAPDATLVSAVNALGAWAITEGSAGITVAVLDTGVRLDHPDLAGKLQPGYDFVSRTTTANDGNGRDADANDPGDWSTASDSCGASNSSWHGTQVAGLIGAATDNGIGMAGTGRNTRVLPVRVLGRCGGWDDDIQAGMRWAGGLDNATCDSARTRTATCNPNPARVLNLSLGSSGTCSQAYRDLIAELNAAGVVVVVASGNDAGRAVNEPANCAGALAVAGVRHAGTKVGYSNLGPQVAIAAPAGNCVNLSGACLYPLVTTLNAGTTTPGAPVYSTGSDPSLGTSFAAPIVAGSVGLMLAVNPALTPDRVKTLLQSSARSFPTVGAQANGTRTCRAPDALDQIECYCTTSTCGAGLLDVAGAVAKAAAVAAPLQAVFLPSNSNPTAGLAIQLDSKPSSRAVTVRNWSVLAGPTQATIEAGSASELATLQTTTAGTVVVRLQTQDAVGQQAILDKTITVKTAPTAALSASNPYPTVGAQVMLDASTSFAMPGRTIRSYEWSLGGTTRSPTPARFITATNASTAVVVPEAAGDDLLVRVRVVDSEGEAHEIDQTLDVAEAPTARITLPSAIVSIGQRINLSAASSAAASGHAIAAYQWSVVSGGTFVAITSGASTASATLEGLSAGSAIVELMVTDEAGGSHTVSQSITVSAESVVVTPSSGGSGGGGAMGAGWVIGLLAAAGLLRRRAPRPPFSATR